MTTRITVERAGHYILISCSDMYTTPAGLHRSHYEETILRPQDKEPDAFPWVGYCTTSRTYTFKDLEPDDPRVLELEGQLKKEAL